MRIDGKQIASEILKNLQKKVEELSKQRIVAHLAVILIGDNPASESYVRQKKLKGEAIGASVTVLNLPSSTSQSELFQTIEQLNNDSNIHGIIVQRPVPQQINAEELDLAILPIKDIDSFHPDSPYPMPLAQAVIKILEEVFSVSFGSSVSSGSFVTWLKTKKIVVIGKGKTGGGPTIELLRKMGGEPEVIDSKTENPHKILSLADIVISAIGKADVFDANNLKQDSIVIQIGMHKRADGKLHGDFDEQVLEQKRISYTPVPGGVGPVNVACLLENLVCACKPRTI